MESYLIFSGSIGLALYIIWFIFINKCSLESSVIKTLVTSDKYKIEDTNDLFHSFIFHITMAPIVTIFLAFIWFISIPTYIIYKIYKKKYLSKDKQC